MPKMRRSFKFFAPLIAGALLLACSSEKEPSLVAFDLEETGSYGVQLRNADGTFTTVDTLDIVGNDVFEIGFDTTRMVSFLPVSGELPVVHAIIGPETKTLRISADGYISGDRENDWLGAQRKMQLDLIGLIDSLDQVRLTYEDSSTFNGLERLDSVFFNYANNYRQRMLDSLEQAPELLANLMIIYHRIGQKPVVDYMVDRELFLAADSALQLAHAGSDDVAAFSMWVDEFEESYQFTKKVEDAAIKFTEGSPFPELILEDPQGNLTHIEKMSLENEVVAIWASWCTPCRSELKRQSLEGTFHGWTLLSIDGLPQQRSPLGEWYEAIQQDGLSGARHLSDLGGQRSKIIATLGVDQLPLYFKVENGIITKRVSSISEL